MDPDAIRRFPFLPHILATVVALVDLGTKAWARASFDEDLVHNPGIAFGISAEHPGLATTLAAAGVLVLALWALRPQQPLLRTGLTLVLGGGLGNLADRLGHGSVTDWIHVAGYPATFNLADLAVRSGALLMLVALLHTPSRHRPSARFWWPHRLAE
jgi:signal peptidase II